MDDAAWLRVNLYAPFDFPYTNWSSRVKMEDLEPEPHFVARLPPTYTVEGEGADRVVRLHGAEDWADDYLVIWGLEQYYYWVPAGWDTVRIGRTPDCGTPGLSFLFTGAYRYDEELPEQDHWFGQWWGEHLVETARQNGMMQ